MNIIKDIKILLSIKLASILFINKDFKSYNFCQVYCHVY